MDDIALKIWKEAACGDARALLSLAREYTGASLVLGDPILSVTAVACETDTDGWIWEDYIREHGGKQLTLFTNSEKNLAFYRKNGLEIFDERDILLPNGDKMRSWSVKKDL